MGAERLPHALTVPGTYVTPSACGGSAVDVSLTLYPDSLFALLETYRDGDCEEEIAFLYMGQWTLSGDGRDLRLLGAVASPRRFIVVDRRTLRVADEPPPRADSMKARRVGRPVRLVPFRDPFRLRGLARQDPTVGS